MLPRYIHAQEYYFSPVEPSPDHAVNSEVNFAAAFRKNMSSLGHKRAYSLKILTTTAR
jgi:hypothetical protein